MKAYWGSVSIDPRILNLGARWRWEVNFMPLPVYPQGKSPWYPLDRSLGGLQSWCGLNGEKNSQLLPGLEPPVILPVAQVLYHWAIPAAAYGRGQKNSVINNAHIHL
jgi:hypothetical protein